MAIRGCEMGLFTSTEHPSRDVACCLSLGPGPLAVRCYDSDRVLIKFPLASGRCQGDEASPKSCLRSCSIGR